MWSYLLVAAPYFRENPSSVCVESSILKVSEKQKDNGDTISTGSRNNSEIGVSGVFCKDAGRVSSCVQGFPWN